MEVEPVAVGLASRAWAEQHLDLVAASRQVRRAATGGFTQAVADAATRFTDAWTDLTAGLGSECEAWAEGLRRAAGDQVATDEEASRDLLALVRHPTQPR